jgi:hypothetical protein
MADKLITDKGYSAGEAARSLGIGETLLRSWKQTFEQQGVQAFPGARQPPGGRGGTAPARRREQTPARVTRHFKKSDGLLRWQAHRQSTVSGHVYQYRFKAFPVETDDHLYSALRYVERNPQRAGLVQQAEQWAWSSLSAQTSGGQAAQRLHLWPVPEPQNWISLVAEPLSEAALADLRHSVIRGPPIGSEDWTGKAVEQLGLQSTVRRRGRPRKKRDLL